VDSNGTTFWKYNFLSHWADCHVAETGKPESISLELYIATHVRSEEGVKLGVSREVTKAWRELNKLPDSDAFDAPIDAPIDDQGKHPEDERELERRKRGVSNVSASTASSQGRNPSPTKKRR
jgi:hypothetical protein